MSRWVIDWLIEGNRVFGKTYNRLGNRVIEGYGE